MQFLVKSLKGPIAIGTIRTSLVLGLRMAAQAGTLILLLSAIGPDVFGAFAGLSAMAVVLGTMANFGSHIALLRDVSRDVPDIERALRLALGTTTLFGLNLLLIYLVVVYFLLNPLKDINWYTIFFIGCAELVVHPFLVLTAMERHGRGEIARSQIILMSPPLVRLIVMLAVTGYAPTNPVSWYAFGHLVAVLLPLTYACRKSSSVWRHPLSWRVARISELRGLAGYAVMGISSSGVAELDKILSVRYLPSDAAGIYSSASRIVGSLVLPVMAMILSAMPRLFRDRTSSGRKLQCYLFLVAGLYGCGAGLSVAYSAPWLELLLGDSYSGVADVIYLLAFAVPATSVRATATNILSTQERPWLRILLEFFGWVLVIVLVGVLVEFCGISGFALAIIYTEWVLAACSVALVLLNVPFLTEPD